MDLAPFFSAYAKAHQVGEAAALKSFFFFPCMVQDAGGVHALGHFEDLEAYAQPFLELLSGAWVQDIEAEVLATEPANDDAINVLVRYRIYGEEEALLMDFLYAYSLVSGAAPKIFFAQFRGDVVPVEIEQGEEAP